MNSLPIESLAITQLRPSFKYWRYRLEQLLIPMVGGGMLTYFAIRIDELFFAALFGCLVAVSTFQAIYQLWRTRTLAITFYPTHFTIREGRTVKTLPYAEVEVISRQPNPMGRPESETISLTYPEGQIEVVIDPYHRETLWQTLQQYIPATAFAHDAAKHSSYYQRQAILISTKFDAKHSLRVSDTSETQQQLISGIAFLWGIVPIVIGVRMNDISWAFCLAFILLLYIVARMVRGNIELSTEAIAHQGVLGRWKIRWDEIEYAETDFVNKVRLGNHQKWLTLPVEGNWSGKDKRLAYDFFKLQLAQRGIVPQKSKPFIFRLSAKNTLVRRKIKS